MRVRLRRIGLPIYDRVHMLVPDLYTTLPPERASRLYMMALIHCRDPNTTITFCRRVRAFAIRAGDQLPLLSMCFSQELEALLRLGKPRRALALLRRHLRMMNRFGIDLADNIQWLDQFMAPVLFSSGRYAAARAIRERFLDDRLSRPDMPAFDVLYKVYNEDIAPPNTARLTLFHIYQALGVPLSSWSLWAEFVQRLHPDLLLLANVNRDDLLSDPHRLKTLFDAIQSLRAVRLTSGVSCGQADLVEPAEMVADRQKEILAQRREFEERTAEKRAETAAEVHHYFPFLRRPSSPR